MGADRNDQIVAANSFSVADVTERLRKQAAGLHYCVSMLSADDRGYYMDRVLVSACEDQGIRSYVNDVLLFDVHRLTYERHRLHGQHTFAVHDENAWGLVVLRWVAFDRLLCFIGRGMDFGLKPGGDVHDPSVALALQLIDLAQADHDCRRADNQRELTERELECLAWSSRGKTSDEIAIIIGLSHHTINQHLQSATRKLGASNRMHAVAIALNSGLIALTE